MTEMTAMDHIGYLVDLHRDGPRQGPGSAAVTAHALDLSGLRGRAGLVMADIGCGTGAATCDLARALDARITAVDLLPDFLTILADRATACGLGDRILPCVATMQALPFAPASLDAIWSEGAIYNMGFAAGIAAWRAFLKPGGVLAVSELTWLTPTRPAALHDHWMREYPEVATAGTKIAQLEQAGYALRGYFPLPPDAWLDGYYDPLAVRFAAFLARHADRPEARAIIAAEEAEIALYRAHQAHVSYGFYIAVRQD